MRVRVCLLCKSTVLDWFQPKLIWSILGGRGRARSGCRCIWLRCAAPSLATKYKSAYISATTQPILIKIGVWMHALCASIILKNQDNQGAQRRVTAPKLEMPNLGNRWTNFNQSWRVGGYTMRKSHSKRSGRSRCAASSYCLTLGSLGPRCEVPGIEAVAPSQNAKRLQLKDAAPSSLPS